MLQMQNDVQFYNNLNSKGGQQYAFRITTKPVHFQKTKDDHSERDFHGLNPMI